MKKEIRRNNLNKRYSSRTTLLVSLLLMALVPSLTINIIHYRVTRNNILKSVIEDNRNLLSNIANNIERTIDDFEYFTLILNSKLSDSSYLGLKDMPTDQVGYDLQLLRVVDELDRIYSWLDTQFINELILVSTEDEVLLRYGDYNMISDPDQYSMDKIKNEADSRMNRLIWGKPIPNPIVSSTYDEIIPVYVKLYDYFNNKPNGSVILIISPRFFNFFFKSIRIPDMDFFEIRRNDGDLLFSSNPELSSGLELDKTIEYEIVQVNLYDDEWIIMTYIDKNSLAFQKDAVLLNIAIIMTSSLIFVIIFSTIIAGNFTRPIQKIIQSVQRIAEGDFLYKIPINTNNELQLLKNSIEEMGTKITTLYEKQRKDEQEKIRIELELLRNQINPHFLYNTLDSIKWIASMQGNNSIVEISRRTATILRSVVGRLDEKITLRDELKLIDDYLFIHKVRYRSRLSYDTDIEYEKLLDCVILKFILQPIVENSIFHGLEPKGGSGNIRISIYTKDLDSIVIEVFDDGVGMSRDELQYVQDMLLKPVNENTDHIGVLNVHKRIVYNYGIEYGITLDSEKDRYTKIMIHLPLNIQPVQNKGELV